MSITRRGFGFDLARGCPFYSDLPVDNAMDLFQESQIIGYTASTATILAFGFQFIHTVRCGTIEGISLPRTAADSISLAMWVLYATRTEDYPLLIASSCELFLSLCVGLVIMKYILFPKKKGVEMIMDKPVIILIRDSSSPPSVLMT